MDDLADTTKYYHDRIFVFCIKKMQRKKIAQNLFVRTKEKKRTKKNLNKCEIY